MKPATTLAPEAVPSLRASAKLADFVELTKPRIAVLVLFTVATGALLALPSLADLGQLWHALFGTALVACGASALNQLLERHTDALMRRTENRPLPAGRLTPAEVFFFGMALGLVGLTYLAVTLRHPLPVIVAAATFVLYVFVYTPLKRKTTLNTLIGAVPGALPPVIGWTAMTGSVSAEVLPLFLVLFVWQVPHFLAIAWIYRADYGRAGLKMLPVVDETGAMTGRQMLLYCLTLCAVSLMPVLGSEAGVVFAVGSLALGLFFAGAAWRFSCAPSYASARRALHVSLVYLPGWLALLLVQRWIG